MITSKQHTGVKGYLEQIGILQTGSKEEIAKAKKDYWRIYDKEYKRRKRRAKREYIVSFSSEELPIVVATAKEKGMKIPQYLREAAMADMQNTYVIPYPHVLREIAQLLKLYRSDIKSIAEKDSKNWLGVSRNYENLETIIQKLRAEINNLFKNGPPLAKVVEEALKRNPHFLTALTNLMQKYHGGQKHDTENK